jgi:DNA/RNA endonuclease G (NUC1)/predicted extracellular nuclease
LGHLFRKRKKLASELISDGSYPSGRIAHHEKLNVLVRTMRGTLMSKSTPQSAPRSRYIPLIGAALSAIFALGLAVQPMRTVHAVSTGVVISQVYGGGGNAGATLKNDFIELFNRGTSSVSLNGWSVQYASSAGTTWTATNLTNVSLAPGQYYLIQEQAGAGGTVSLPSPDASGNIAMSATAAKVALTNSTAVLSGSCPSGGSLVDLIGFGGANCFEGTGFPALTNTTAAIRNNSGCTDTDNNASDFASGAPSPRNTATALHPCTVNQAIVPSCPASLNTVQGTPTSTGVSARDPDGTVTSATITSTPVTGITLTGFTPASGVGGTANATLNVSNATAPGTYNVVIQYQNNDSPTPQTATCTVVVTVTPPNQPIAPSCPGSLNVNQGSAGSTGVSASDPDGTVTGASITSAPVTGITLTGFTPAGVSGGTANATLSVANTTAIGNYNVDIQWANNDSPTPQTATCTVAVSVQPPPGRVVISQVYGGGGNVGSTLRNDYIELINHSSSPVNLSGWSVQAFVSTTNTWQVTPLTNFTLQPGQYYLIQESAQGGGTENLPPPDAVGTIPVSSTSTKVALVSNTTTITASCPNAGVVDLVGYGSTDCFEGTAPAPTLSSTIADLRRDSGCFDTDNNSADFVTGTPNPRNSSSPTHDCTSLSAFGSANPSSVVQGDSTTLTVHVAFGQNPTSTGIGVSADLTSIGGSASQSFAGAGNTFSYNASIPANQSPGMKSLPVTVTDFQGRTANTNILLSVLPIIPDHITISQLYGGGGNAGAPYTNDYVELYNPTAATVSITGWSIQYASAAGTSWVNKQPIGGIIGPGEYYLISLASGGSNGVPLPVTPNISGTINMSATTGKLALVKNSATLAGDCPLGDPNIVDFVGYGSGATCREGNANTPAPSNTLAIFRKNGGGTDSDQNGNDFTNATPPNPPNPRRTAPIVELGPWVAGTDPGTDDTTIPHDASVTVNFSEPVNVDSGWYNITCATTGSHNDATEAHTPDLKTYAITPNTNFQFGEQCSVTITHTAVHDQDTDDSDPNTDTLFDDYTWSFTVVGAGQPAPYPPSVHLTMGNPNNAVADVNQPLNYLMMKPTYALSYNRDKGTPNWVSWHLDNSWYGSLARVDTFRPDPAVPSDWYRVQAFDYAGTGFDRGHMTPNADRDNQNRIPINQETYLMSNMVPQAPNNNQGPWADLEAYLRTLTDSGNEIYIVSGPYGVGGIGSASVNTVTTIANGHVTVPASTWKVALVMPKADGDDVARVTCSTRTIAVLMPNTQGLDSNWQHHLTTIDAIEQLTGYDFYSNLPQAVQGCVEGGTNGTNPPGTANESANTTEDNAVTVTLQALQANNNTVTFSIVNGPTSGSLGSVSPASCASGTCTATVTYTPGADFYGSDSFTFRASDGSLNSNTSTVSVSITEVNDSPIASDDTKTTSEDTQLSFSSSDLTANDSPGPLEAGQSLTVTSVTGNANTHGTVNLASGTVTYTPTANFNGPASFTYTVCDNGTTNGSADPKCTTGTVNVTVTPVNDAPTADNQNLSTGGNTPVAITLTGSDLETPPANLTFNVTSGPAHGTLSGTAPNLTYTPALDYCGLDTFKFTVTDSGDGSAAPLTSSEATVSITVNDTIGPTITLTGGSLTLSPSNHKYQTVSMSDMVASASDHCDSSVDISDVVITKVTSDELDDAPGNDDGSTINDIVIAPNCRSVQLRAERNGSLNGRVYTVTLKVADSAGNTTTTTRKITVPIGSATAVDSGPAYTVNSLCP